MQWGCHVAHKRLNICDHSPVSTDTVLMDPIRMSTDKFLNEYIESFVSSDKIRSHLLAYCDGIELPADVIAYTMPIKQHLRFCSKSTFHTEEWVVVRIADTLFAIGQPSDII